MLHGEHVLLLFGFSEHALGWVEQHFLRSYCEGVPDWNGNGSF